MFLPLFDSYADWYLNNNIVMIFFIQENLISLQGYKVHIPYFLWLNNATCIEFCHKSPYVTHLLHQKVLVTFVT